MNGNEREWRGPTRVEWFIEDDAGPLDAVLAYYCGEIFIAPADDRNYEMRVQISVSQIDRLIANLKGLKDAIESGGLDPIV